MTLCIHICASSGLSFTELSHPHHHLPPTQQADSNSYVPFANHDSEYMYWCTDGKQLGPDFVMLISGTAPTVASGLYDLPIPAAEVVRTCGGDVSV